jgi:hypothetical protein
VSLGAAAHVMREAMRETVRRHSLWSYTKRSDDLGRNSSASLSSSVVGWLVFLLDWLLIISGIVQSISLEPHDVCNAQW